MRTLHRYLLQEVLATLLMTVGVFTFVLLLGNVLKEILGLLVNRQADLGTVGMAVLLLIPYVLVFALPMGLLTATLLVFGRCSADNELTAARANGISLVALVSPVLFLACALSLASALFNMQVGPRCRVAYKKLLFEMGLERVSTFLPEKVFIKDFRERIIYIDRVEGSNLKDILIYNLDTAGRLRSYVRAEAGTLAVDRERNLLTLQLRQAWLVEIAEGQRTPNLLHAAEATYTNELLEAEQRIKLSDMTIFELYDELHDLERHVQASEGVRKLSSTELQDLMRQLQKQRADITLPVKMQIHRQVSFSFACLAFTLVGIPLGIRAHRRETTFGIAVALILVALYYSFFILANALESKSEWSPHLLQWMPNFIFHAVGMVLLWRANRGL